MAELVSVPAPYIAFSTTAGALAAIAIGVVILIALGVAIVVVVAND